MTIRVLDPTQPPEILPAVLAPRKDLQRPLTVACLSNGKTHADRLMQLVTAGLSRQLQIAEISSFEKESTSTNASAALLDQIADGCDLALVAIGD